MTTSGESPSSAFTKRLVRSLPIAMGITVYGKQTLFRSSIRGSSSGMSGIERVTPSSDNSKFSSIISNVFPATSSSSPGFFFIS